MGYLNPTQEVCMSRRFTVRRGGIKHPNVYWGVTRKDGRRRQPDRPQDDELTYELFPSVNRPEQHQFPPGYKLPLYLQGSPGIHFFPAPGTRRRREDPSGYGNELPDYDDEPEVIDPPAPTRPRSNLSIPPSEVIDLT